MCFLHFKHYKRDAILCLSKVIQDRCLNDRYLKNFATHTERALMDKLHHQLEEK